jgi:hypothetical protein
VVGGDYRTAASGGCFDRRADLQALAAARRQLAELLGCANASWSMCQNHASGDYQGKHEVCNQSSPEGAGD